MATGSLDFMQWLVLSHILILLSALKLPYIDTLALTLLLKNNVTLSSIPALSLTLTFSPLLTLIPTRFLTPNKFTVLTPTVTHSGPHTPSHPHTRSLSHIRPYTDTLAFSLLLILTPAHPHICSFYTCSHSPSHLFILTLAHSHTDTTVLPLKPSHSHTSSPSHS